jgi:hypothetical protein
MPVHYAPCVPLELSDDAAGRVAELLARGLRVGWLSRGEGQRRAGDESPPSNPALANRSQLLRLDMPADAAAYAAQLYAALHRLEDAGVERIVVSRPPEAAEWQAVRDRLERAAAKGC